MALNVVKTNSDYKLKVVEGGQITLDTGLNVGEVYITGNLRVDGTTTTINSQNLDIEDNIITLNKGETGNGVSENTSGIQIDRGISSTGSARIFWDETQTWNDPNTQTIRNGLFVFSTESGGLNGIRTNSIDTNGGNLYLINKSTGIISVSGTVDYERQVLNYDNNLVPIDDDIVPNIRAVTDKIKFEIINNPSIRIKAADTEVLTTDNNISQFVTAFSTLGLLSNQVYVRHNLLTNSDLGIQIGQTVTITNAPNSAINGTWTINTANLNDEFFVITIGTNITLSDIRSSATVIINQIVSNVKIKVNGISYGEFQTTHADFYGVRVQDTTISSTLSNTDLILTSSGTGSVQIQDNLKLAYAFEIPTAEEDTVKIYSGENQAGQTGLYFVNSNYNDELISKKKAIAYSILM